MFNFTSLLGARAASPALQSLLEFEGGIKVLVDVGWDASFDAEALKELERSGSPLFTKHGARGKQDVTNEIALKLHSNMIQLPTTMPHL